MARHEDRDKTFDTLPDNDAQSGQRETTMGHDIDDWLDPDSAAERAEESDERARMDDAPGMPDRGSDEREEWQG
ncbi:hypothetical protein [Microcella sp.]|uniref:hypothetical protein n=1 Tax=Microcella sp. TaxID=1913979 RepID=UPI003918CF48